MLGCSGGSQSGLPSVRPGAPAVRGTARGAGWMLEKPGSKRIRLIGAPAFGDTTQLVAFRVTTIFGWPDEVSRGGQTAGA